MFELSIRGDIASAHFLRGYEGKCKNLHGHTWKIEVTVVISPSSECSLAELNETGMVADFTVLKKKLKEFLDVIDHACLNDLPFFKEVNPTTENIAKYIYTRFAGVIKPLKIKAVQVWESDTSSVTYYE